MSVQCTMDMYIHVHVDALAHDDLTCWCFLAQLQRRAGMVSHFMCAVAVAPEIPGDKPSLFHSFCKVHVQ